MSALELVRVFIANDRCPTCGGQAKMSPRYPHTSMGPACNDTWHRLVAPSPKEDEDEAANEERLQVIDLQDKLAESEKERERLREALLAEHGEMHAYGIAQGVEEGCRICQALHFVAGVPPQQEGET